jgi:hypothetical protein
MTDLSDEGLSAIEWSCSILQEDGPIRTPGSEAEIHIGSLVGEVRRLREVGRAFEQNAWQWEEKCKAAEAERDDARAEVERLKRAAGTCVLADGGDEPFRLCTECAALRDLVDRELCPGVLDRLRAAVERAGE